MGERLVLKGARPPRMQHPSPDLTCNAASRGGIEEKWGFKEMVGEIVRALSQHSRGTGSTQRACHIIVVTLMMWQALKGSIEEEEGH